MTEGSEENNENHQPGYTLFLLKSEPFLSILRVKVVLLAPYWAASATYLGHDKVLHATFR